jgi:hypothetical protein
LTSYVFDGDVIVPPGSTMSMMFLVVRAPDEATAVARAAELATWPDYVFENMSAEEVAALVN